MSKKIIQCRNNSGEIDVFEATNYFSTTHEDYYNNNNQIFHHNKQNLRGGRMSFDMPMMRNSSSSLVVPSQTATNYNQHIMDHQKPIMMKQKDQKKYKQPSSPGGRLASFLNSLFNQTSSKKKKSLKDIQEDDQSPSGRRKRRSSISHFSFRSSSNITTTTINTTTTNSTSSDSKSSSNSGFRTPPPYAPTPTKSYKDFKSLAYADHHNKKSNTSSDYSWLDEKLIKNNGVYNKINNTNNGLLLEKNKTYNKVVDDHDIDDGDSESSSDLFDLPNIDLDYYSSSGLPVYETTHMDNIKRGAPIPSGVI
uniref:Protein BIG GRAIN 1-like E n=2 Tax=Solanum lycopersicum TaxID=4081 RepID=A0A3Q7GFI3_SOLLC